MQNAPKIVRERLRAAMPAVNHPGPDVLTAFSERSLPQLERDIVLEHLARCGDCRDVVALALPATEPLEIPAKAPSGGWLAWPALRWGFVAAGILAIGSLGIVQFQRRSESQKKFQATLPQAADTEAARTEAKNEALAVPAAASPAPPARERDETSTLSAATPSATEKKQSANVHLPQVAPPSVNAQQSPGSTNGSVIKHSVAGRTVGGPLVSNQFGNNQWQQNAQSLGTNAFRAPAPAPAAPNSQVGGNASANLPAVSNAAVNGQPSQIDVQSQNVQSQNADALAIQSEGMPQRSADEGYAESKVAKSKPAETVFIGASKSAIRSAPAAFDRLGAGSTLATRWTISSAGGLQRSVDQGNTWQDVSVNAAPGYSSGASAGAPSFEPSTAASAARGKAADKDAKADKLNAPITFRAVAANGADVWAGGSGGLLYHSADAGGHWTRVIPSTNSGVLTGDIISLEFPDAQHGKVSTSTSETWTTSDAGQSWQKQP